MEEEKKYIYSVNHNYDFYYTNTEEKCRLWIEEKVEKIKKSYKDLVIKQIGDFESPEKDFICIVYQWNTLYTEVFLIQRRERM